MGRDQDARSTERDHQARDVVDERGEQEQEREQRVRPAVEDEAQDRQDQVLRPPRNGVVQQQSDREEVEEEEIRAEDHLRASSLNPEPAVRTVSPQAAALSQLVKAGRRHSTAAGSTPRCRR